MSNNRFVSSLKSLAGTLLGAGLIAAAPMVVSSCVHNDPNAERSEFIDVYANLDQEEPATTYSVGVEGGEFRLYVKSNVEFSAQWQDDASTPWATVESVTKEDDNTSVVKLNVSPRSTYAYYTMRTGTLMLMAPELSLGTYVTINQGLYARLSSDFAWSKYGTADPRKDDGTPFSEWSQTNIGRGWTSTKIEGTKGPFFYGKNGYVLLGDDKGHGADLYTPFVNDLISDSLLVVTFRAVAYTDLEGNKDANKLSVEVVGGGVLRDGFDSGERKTKMDIELPYYDMQDEKFPSSMWKGTDFMIGVISAPNSPITGNTRIHFVAGDMSGAEGTPNRVYMDNIYIRRIAVSKTYEDVDLWKTNGSSGLDKVLGNKEESENQ